jgi:hypothetical protein
MNQLLLESIVVGVVLVAISTPVMGLLHYIYPQDYSGCLYLPSGSKLKYYIATFLIGVLTHLLFEYFGANLFYCKNGNACKGLK